MEANVFDLYETEVNAAQLQPFQFKNATYLIDAIRNQTRHITFTNFYGR